MIFFLLTHFIRPPSVDGGLESDNHPGSPSVDGAVRGETAFHIEMKHALQNFSFVLDGLITSMDAPLHKEYFAI